MIPTGRDCGLAEWINKEAQRYHYNQTLTHFVDTKVHKPIIITPVITLTIKEEKASLEIFLKIGM